MPRQNKEEERVEKIIRGLSKLPENKRCINCNSLGPQYVCTNFWTFICTNCSGIHREFTHRVKSVSMAKFSIEEANALQAGGNERARETYFKTLDTQRNAIPDGSNLHRLRDFIKHIYVDCKYAGDQGSDKLAMVKRDAVDDSKDKHSVAERSKQVALDEHSGYNSPERSNRKSRVVSRDESTERPSRSARDAFLELFSNGPFSERPKDVTRDKFSPYSSERSHRGAREDFLGRPSPERRGIGRGEFLDRHSFDSPSRRVRDDFLERHSFENRRGARDGFHEQSPYRGSPRNKREDMNSRNYIEGWRSLSFTQEDTKSGSRKTNKPKFEIVDDRFRDDDTGNAKHFERVRYLNSRRDVRNASPDSQRRRDTRKPLAICPAEEALDKKFPPLKAGESTTRSTDDKYSHDSRTVQKEEGDANPGSTIRKENESNKATTTSLLDSYSKPETASTDKVDEGEKASSADEGERASSFDEGEKKASSIDNGDAPTSAIKEVSNAQNVTPLELLLIDWPEPSNTTPEDSTSTMSNTARSVPSDSTSHNQPQTDLLTQTIVALPDNKNELSPDVQQGVASVVAESNREWSSAPARTDTESLANDLSRPPVLEPQGGNDLHNSNQGLGISGSNESQSSRRKELPANLFAGYPSFQARAPVPVPGWQLHPHQVMGYGMQYQPPVPMCTPPFNTSATSRNPFDVGGDGTQIAAQPFSHIPSLQLAQPNMIVPAGFHNQESARAFSWQSQHYPYGMAVPPGAFQGQEVPYDTMDSRNQHGQISNNAGAFDSINLTRQLPRASSTPNTSSYSSTTG